VARVGRLLLIAIAGVTATALTSVLGATAVNDAKRLVVRTGPGHEIKLTRGGTEVDYVRRGSRTITIRDTSRSHNVVLTSWDRYVRRGPQRVLTGFAFVGTKTVTVKLAPGLYTVSCQRHSSPCPFSSCVDRGMVDSFRVE
jgi:hypothetical protein